MRTEHADESLLFPFPPVAPFAALRRAVRGDEFWEPRLQCLWDGAECDFSVHLAVMVNPYLQRVLDGQKTVESRFSIFRRPPWDCVRRGDVILLKKSGGPVVGICQAGRTWSYVLNPKSLGAIRSEFSEAMAVEDPLFWDAQANARYATLLQVHHARPIAPFPWQKSDRRGWVVLRSGTSADTSL